MEKRLYEKLNEIKKEKREIRLEKLEEICRDNDNDMINDALYIAKHESSIYLPGVALITAVAALILSFYNNTSILSFLPSSHLIFPWAILIVLFIALIYVFRIIKCEFIPWKEVYYDLIELRMMRREETKPTVLSKLDEIIKEVKAINPRIGGLEINISNKMEALEKEVKSIKSKKW